MNVNIHATDSLTREERMSLVQDEEGLRTFASAAARALEVIEAMMPDSDRPFPLRAGIIALVDGKAIRGKIVGRSHPINDTWHYDIMSRDGTVHSNVPHARISL